MFLMACTLRITVDEHAEFVFDSRALNGLHN